MLSGQSLVVDVTRHPNVRSVDDLRGLVIGVQQGNTSQPVADRLVAEGRAARVRVYPYDAINTALDDLSNGGCDAFMKLAPVMHWLTRDRPKLKVVADRHHPRTARRLRAEAATPNCATRSTRRSRRCATTAPWRG